MKYFLILFTCFMLLVIAYHFATAEPPMDEKKLREAFYEKDFILKDTVFYYRLDEDSLVLSMEADAQFSRWNFYVVIEDDRKIEQGFYFEPQTYEFIDNKLVIKGFHIDRENLKHYEPRLVGFPETSNEWCIVKRSALGCFGGNDDLNFSMGFYNTILFFKRGKSHKLSCFDKVQKQHYVAFNIGKANTLPEEERDYCFRFMYKKLGYTDALIDGVFEEAKRNAKENKP